MILKATITVFLCVFLIDNAEAHSFLINPPSEAQNLLWCRRGGPREGTDNCPGPCVSAPWQLKQRPPVIVYRRGQDVSFSWARNTHIGGFVRFALVPIKDRMRKDAHEKYSFHYTCYDSGKHKCPNGKGDVKERCGTDRYINGAQARIPEVYPDGKYILGWSWFGGVENKKAWFGDYWSCAHVEIRGGPFKSRFKPKFIVESGKEGCYAGVNKLGKCPVEPCENSELLDASVMVPEGFSKSENGAFVSSLNILRSDLDANYDQEFTTPSPIAHSSVPPTPDIITTTNSAVPSRSAAPSISIFETPTSSFTSSVLPTPTPTISLTPLPSSTTFPTPTPTPTKATSPSVTPSSSPIPSTITSTSPTSPQISGPTPSPSYKQDPRITSLVLVSISNGIQKITDNFVKPINLNQYREITLQAETSGEFSRVEFYVDFQRVQTEYLIPYVLSGNIGLHYNEWKPPTNRWMYVMAVGYVKDKPVAFLIVTMKFVRR